MHTVKLIISKWSDGERHVTHARCGNLLSKWIIHQFGGRRWRDGKKTTSLYINLSFQHWWSNTLTGERQRWVNESWWKNLTCTTGPLASPLINHCRINRVTLICLSPYDVFWLDTSFTGSWTLEVNELYRDWLLFWSLRWLILSLFLLIKLVSISLNFSMTFYQWF